MKLMKQVKMLVPYFIVVVFFFVGLFVYTRVAGPVALSVNSNVTNQSDIFTVSGEGKVEVKPEIAYVRVGMESNGSSVGQVQTEIDGVMERVIGALEELGIDREKEMETVSYSINPLFDWSSGRQRITGYSASTQLEIKVREIDRVNEVVDAAVESGANQVGGVSFDVEDREKIEEEARKEAVEQAKRKAEAAAKAAGFRLGRIVNYSESSNGVVPQPMYDRAMAAGEAAPELSSAKIQPGVEEIEIVVSLSYQIE